MNNEIKKFIEILDSEVEINEDILQMNLEDFSDLIHKFGFDFSLDEFINKIKEIDEKELLKSELEDEELDKVSAGLGLNYSIINLIKKIN